MTTRPMLAPEPALAPDRREPPPWSVRTAHVVALVALPSGIWRLGLAAGLPLGYTEAGYENLVGDGGTWGLVLLTVVTEALALLALGLVRPWGERVPAGFVIVPAALGSAGLVILWTPLLTWWSIPHPGMTDTGSLVVGLLYLPLVAWGPLLAALTVDHARRRRRG